MTGPRHVPSFVLLFPLLICGMLSVPRAAAQADVTAYKKADISAFVMFTSNKPDYGEFRNSGVTLGADYTRYFHWWVQPSLEIRGGTDSGKLIKQKTALVGLRLKADFRHRYHPYGDFLVGGSWIDFVVPPVPGYNNDQGFTRSYGGGIEVDVWKTWGAKFDYQGEHTVYTDRFNPIHLTPGKVSAGVVYRFPFKKHLGHGYER